MAIDRKYGRVKLEHGTIGEDEPVVVFRAQDRLLPKVLAYYRLFCWKEGSPQRHLELVDASLAAVEQWQTEGFHRVHTPDSESSRAWLDQDLNAPAR